MLTIKLQLWITRAWETAGNSEKVILGHSLLNKFYNNKYDIFWLYNILGRKLGELFTGGGGWQSVKEILQNSINLLPSLIPVSEKIQLILEHSATPGVQGARQEILVLSLSLSCPLLPPLLGLKCVALCLTFNAVSFFLPLETSLGTTIFKHYMWKAFSSVWNGCLTLTFCVQRKHFIYSNHLLVLWIVKKAVALWEAGFSLACVMSLSHSPHFLPVFSYLLFTVILLKVQKPIKQVQRGCWWSKENFHRKCNIYFILCLLCDDWSEINFLYW